MLAVLITLTPGCWKEFIDCQNTNARIAVPPIMDVNTQWNSTLEFLERACRFREFTPEWWKHPKYSDYRSLYAKEDEWTILKYIIEVLMPFQSWTLWMAKTHMVALHQVITIYNYMFVHMDGVLWALAKDKSQWKEHLYFSVKFARQKLSKY